MGRRQKSGSQPYLKMGTIHLIHSKGGEGTHHKFLFCIQESKMDLSDSVRIWKKRDAAFFDYLVKQHNPQRYCPICNPTSEKYAEKWDTKVEGLGTKNLDII